VSRSTGVAPRFVEFPEGRLFVCEFLPDDLNRSGHAVVVVPPFAEEMNRCRRMVAQQARALAAGGHGVVLFDLFGTGDSEGDFAEARWHNWTDSIESIVAWTLRNGYERYSLLALRAGALLAFSAPRGVIERATRTVLWQPCTSGRTYLRQFLRMRVASGMSEAAGGRKETIESLMSRFSAGESLEVGGYELDPQLAACLDAASLDAEVAAAASGLPPGGPPRGEGG